ncbi:amidase family protein [Roseococcus sp. MDT2-1-1]|uniref:Amidase family protein n=2 Tax=Sabulicella glaciei TaxID=2984948 RepID=A0ABT3NYX7_9PROT|nr:amidase family protein [Roseococcus sp. MDT2-1-1]
MELLDPCLARINRVNPAVNAIVTLDEGGTRAGARAAEATLMRSDELGPLHGRPIAIKDTEDTARLRTTYISAIFSTHVPGRDLGVVARLRAAGAIVVGKTNTPEFAAGANTRNMVHGATGNRFDPSRSAARSRPARHGAADRGSPQLSRAGTGVPVSCEWIVRSARRRSS